MKRTISLFLAAVMLLSAVLSLASCKGSESGEKVLTYATSAAWDGFNVYATTTSSTDYVVEFFLDRLFDQNYDGSMYPRLATGYSVNDTFDVYTVYLHKDAKWHDGEPVTAEDVVYTYRLMSTAEQPEWYRRTYFTAIAGTDANGIELSEDSIQVEALDNYTVQFTLKAPVDEMTFMSSFKAAFIYPKHILGAYTDAEIPNAPYWNAPVGSGPMKFDSSIEGERIELVRFDDYYLGAVDFDRLIIRVMDASAITAGIMNGEVDFTTSLVALDVSYLEETGNYVIESFPSFTYTNLVFNLSDKLFSDQRVRLAFAYAINRQAIADNVYLGYAQIITALFPSTHPYFNEAVAKNPYDPAAAKALLKEAGWDFDTVVEFQVNSGNESRLQTALLIQQDLEAIGVKTSLVTYDFPTVMQNMREETFQILMMGNEGTALPTSFAGTIAYFSHTTDPEILADIGNGKAVLTREEKKTYYDDLQVLLYERAPLLYFCSPNAILVHSSRLSLDTTNLNINISKRVWSWKVS